MNVGHLPRRVTRHVCAPPSPFHPDVDYGVHNLQHVEHVDRFDTGAVADNAAFFYAFVLSLCLNWVGFLAAYTYSGSTSGRCGAMSGFGLSMMKVCGSDIAFKSLLVVHGRSSSLELSAGDVPTSLLTPAIW